MWIGDFGVGWGYLVSEILKCDGVKVVDLIEVECLLFDCVVLNVVDDCVVLYWVDVMIYDIKVVYDVVIMNLLFY